MNLKCNRRYIILLPIAIFFLYFNWLSVDLVNQIDENVVTETPGMKYILQWNGHYKLSYIQWDDGKKEFTKRKCKFTNCYITRRRKLLKSIIDYDAVVFQIPGIAITLPRIKYRSEHQKYVYVSMESAKYFPLCDEAYDDFFNWTWTYKLDSDLTSEYITVRNIDGDIIGPKQNMEWIEVDLMKPINDTVRERLKTKNKAAAWFVSNCEALSKRHYFTDKLRFELQNYNLQLDVFGKCGKKKCPRDKMDDCLKMIESDYYFYLVFENSFADDYVTEKLLWALQHYAVPVVLGGANYTRFMPDGIYLDGGKLKPKALAKEMADIIKDKERYYNFFKWHNHYSYSAKSDSPDMDNHCKMCEMLHDEDLMRKTTVYKDFRKWWNLPDECPSDYSNNLRIKY